MRAAWDATRCTGVSAEVPQAVRAVELGPRLNCTAFSKDVSTEGIVLRCMLLLPAEDLTTAIPHVKTRPLKDSADGTAALFRKTSFRQSCLSAGGLARLGGVLLSRMTSGAKDPSTCFSRIESSVYRTAGNSTWFVLGALAHHVLSGAPSPLACLRKSA